MVKALILLSFLMGFIVNILGYKSLKLYLNYETTKFVKKSKKLVDNNYLIVYNIKAVFVTCSQQFNIGDSYSGSMTVSKTVHGSSNLSSPGLQKVLKCNVSRLFLCVTMAKVIKEVIKR